MSEIKELLGKESLLAIKDYIDTKTGSASPKTEVVDLDTFVACEDTALIQHFGEELPMTADDLIFNYFFTGSKCVTKDTTYETIKGLDITEAKYNAIKESMILSLTTATFPVAIEIADGSGNISLRKQSIGTKTDDGNTIEVIYFASETHQAVALNMLVPAESGETPVAIHAIYYFKVASGTGTRDYISFTNADQLSDAELAEAISSTDFNILLNKAVKITKGWKKTVPITDVYKYYPWEVLAGDEHAYRDNFMWVSVPGRTLATDYLVPGPFLVLLQTYVSDSLVGFVSGTNDEGVIEILQYEPIDNEAAAFSTTSTYTVGSLVTYQGKLYKCTKAVTSAGSWSASNWTQVTVNDAFLPLTAGQNKALTGVLYSDVNDVNFVGKQGKIGFRAYKPNTTDNAAQMLLTSDSSVSGSYRLSIQAYNKTKSDIAGSAVYNTFRVGDSEGLTYKIGSDVLLKVNDSGTATVAADPVNNLDVATKQYVDTSIGSRSTATNLENGTGTNAVQEKMADATVDFTGRNPNAEAIDSTLSAVISTGASGNQSAAFGKNTMALATASFTNGNKTLAKGEESHAEGYQSVTLGDGSHAEGSRTTAYGSQSHAEGIETIAYGNDSHSEGEGTQARGINSHSEGYYTQALGNASHAEGSNTVVNAITSHAEGVSNYIGAQQSDNPSSGSDTSSTQPSGYTPSKGEGSHAEGYDNFVYGIGSHAEGAQNVVSGDFAHAEGLQTTASNTASHSEGYRAKATGLYSHAEGSNTESSGENSHAEGDHSQANGSNSFAGGNYARANGSNSFAFNGITSGEGSIAFNGTASNEYAVSLGYGSSATGKHSFTANDNNIAGGNNSVALGNECNVSGNLSFAVGYGNTVSGTCSMALGRKLSASGNFQAVVGQWNTADSNARFIVGNGTADNAHSNAFEVYEDGHAEVGLMGSTNKSVVTKEYVDKKENLIETTWSALKSLRDNSQLVPGKFYRITDYQCTTIDPNTSSAGHQFDIIVLALATNKLSEQAWAAKHSGDSYFSDDLEKWRLWYALDNNTYRFSWADSTNGKGVIYRMIDEFDNDVPYDFKNILTVQAPKITLAYRSSCIYRRDPTKDANNYYGWLYCGYWPMGYLSQPKYVYTDTTSPTTSSSVYSDTNGTIATRSYDGATVTITETALDAQFMEYYTFSYVDSSETTVGDASSRSGSSQCLCNTIMPAFRNGYVSSSGRFQDINRTIFITGTGNTNVYNNYLGYNNYNNVFKYSSKYSSLSVYNNTIGNNFKNNTIKDSFHSNIIRNLFSDNTIGKSFMYNIIGNYFQYNTTGENFENNTFGNNCQHLTFGNYCNYITFGNNCQYITFGNSGSAIYYCRYNIIDSGCQYLYINGSGTASSSSYLQNIHIHLGVRGTSSAYKTITVSRNLAYETNIVATGTTTTEV